MRSTKLRLRGTVAHRHEADEFLEQPGDAVHVVRGVSRSLAMVCPDGCGEKLTINLDSRTGPAWKFFTGDGGSLFPSVWRDTGCKSHFILWRARIYWCDRREILEAPDPQLVSCVYAQLNSQLTDYVVIAQALNEVPWAVLSACDTLCASGRAERGSGRLQSAYRRI